MRSTFAAVARIADSHAPIAHAATREPSEGTATANSPIGWKVHERWRRNGERNLERGGYPRL